MPTNDIVQLKATLKKVSSELSRQAKEGKKIAEKTKKANEKKIRTLLDEGLRGMDPGLQEIILEIYAICGKPFFPFI